MAEHYTQGRQGQGARRRRNNKGRPYRRRMPRAQEAPAPKPSLLQRILGFFGFGKKKDNAKKNDNRNNNKRKPKENVRVAKGRSNQGGNPAARQEKRRRPASVAPTRNARLYVGNLSYEATEAELEDLFKGFGNVRSVEIIYNPRTYKSKGYAFVEMQMLDDAKRAAEVLHGQPFMGRELMVSAASERPEGADKPEETPAEKPAAPAEAPDAAPAEAPADAPESPAAE
ncbi:MAG: RNA-binding protein [Akkermansia sp.]|nr:RNA-binding protein [Akkermansia sp.]